MEIAAADNKQRGLEMLAERWEGAVAKATEKIKAGDASYLRNIRGFRSPEAVVDDLERRKKKAEEEKNSMSSKALSYAPPPPVYLAEMCIQGHR
jgi:hypothetical protein